MGHKQTPGPHIAASEQDVDAVQLGVWSCVLV
jgi:hypothetical protein